MCSFVFQNPLSSYIIPPGLLTAVDILGDIDTVGEEVSQFIAT